MEEILVFDVENGVVEELEKRDTFWCSCVRHSCGPSDLLKKSFDQQCPYHDGPWSKNEDDRTDAIIVQ